VRQPCNSSSNTESNCLFWNSWPARIHFGMTEPALSDISHPSQTISFQQSCTSSRASQRCQNSPWTRNSVLKELHQLNTNSEAPGMNNREPDGTRLLFRTKTAPSAAFALPSASYWLLGHSHDLSSPISLTQTTSAIKQYSRNPSARAPARTTRARSPSRHTSCPNAPTPKPACRTSSFPPWRKSATWSTST
jgi:hypothetical protein